MFETTLGKNWQVSPPREIAAGVWWLPMCGAGGDMNIHLYTSPFLVIGPDKTLLFDTSSPQRWRDVLRALAVLLRGRPLDYLVPSHPEIAHCGATPRLLARYPEAQLLGDVRDYPFYYPQFEDRLIPLPAGSEIDLGAGRRFVLLESVIKDLPSTQWGYETGSQVLFVADGFAYAHHPPAADDDRPVHLASECALMSSELGAPPSDDQIIWITNAALYWTKFVEAQRYFEPMQELLRRYPAKLVAPCHGSVIDNVEVVLPVIWEALRRSYNPAKAVQEAGYAFDHVG